MRLVCTQSTALNVVVGSIVTIIGIMSFGRLDILRVFLGI